MPSDFDIAIVGSGFGGSLLAMILRRLGRSVILLERSRHPRFAIGESSTPLANLLLEQIAEKYSLPRIAPLTKWGSWQKHYPTIGCGLKRGFTFYHHHFGENWRETATRGNQLLVGASPADRIADTHWYRPDFDHFLVREAEACSVEYLDDASLDDVRFEANAVRLSGSRSGKTLSVRCKFLIDATGPRGFLHSALKQKEVPLPHLPLTAGLYSHFRNVGSIEEICPLSHTPPYPVDNAAVHHVFPGGWIWVLQFNNGITSAGVAATAELAEKRGYSDGERGWSRLLDLLPTVKEQFRSAEHVRPFTYAPKLSFQTEIVHGSQWAMLPSAAGFIDPLLSTGFPLTLLGVLRLARLIESYWSTGEMEGALETYGLHTRRELRTTARLIAALYGTMDDFELFSAISLLYFAAASFTESAMRLGKAELAGQSFLLDEHPQFAPEAHQCLELVLGGAYDRAQVIASIRRTIECVDVAGLSDCSRRNWYPARGEDLLFSAAKVRSSKEEVLAMLKRTGFGVM